MLDVIIYVIHSIKKKGKSGYLGSQWFFFATCYDDIHLQFKYAPLIVS